MIGAARRGRAWIARCEIWSTDRMPVDNSDAAAAEQRQGFVVRHNYVGSGQGTVVRITEFAPGSPKFMHRTETLDYAILLSGECDLELDDGKTVHLTQGDVARAASTDARVGQQRHAALRVRLRADRRQAGRGGWAKPADALSYVSAAGS